MGHCSRFGLVAGIVLSCAASLHASVTYVCDSSITGNSNVPAGTCNYLNTTIAGMYGSTFANVNATIYVELGPNAGGESQFNTNGISYATYTTDFKAESTDAAALASLPSSEPDGLSGNVFITAAQGQALGVDVFEAGADEYGVTPNPSDPGGPLTSCQLGTADCYNGVITIGGQLYFRSGPFTVGYDFFSIAEHETDEVLGTASCLTFSGTPPSASTVDGCTDSSGNGLAPTDLYRYTAPGMFAWINAASDHNNTGAYFSVDGGNTVIQTYNNGPNGGDYGDWIFNGNCATEDVQVYVVDSNCSPDITTDAGTPEIQLLNAVGFNLANETPEPATIGLTFSGFAVLGVVLWRRQRAA